MGNGQNYSAVPMRRRPGRSTKRSICLCLIWDTFPGGDKRIITRKESTLAAVDGLLGKLKSKGTGLILSYYGHAGGMEEKNGLEAYLKQLPGKSYDVLQIGMVNRDHFPPVLYVVKKLT